MAAPTIDLAGLRGIVNEALPQVLAMFHRFMRESPQNPDLPFVLAQVLAGGALEARRAGLAFAKAAIDRRPQAADRRALYGNLAFSCGDAITAILFIRQAIVLQPDAVPLYDKLGRLLLVTGDLAGAARSFECALALAPDAASSLLGLSECLAEGGRFTEAEELCRRVLAQGNPNADALVHLGRLLEAQERPAEAEECYRRAVTVEGKSVRPYRHLARLLHAQGRLDEAFAVCRRALTVQPGDTGLVLIQIGIRLDHGELAQAQADYAALAEHGEGVVRPCQMMTVPEWCATTGSPFHPLAPASRVPYPATPYVGEPVEEEEAGAFPANALYVAALRNARVLSRSHLILVDDGRVGLIDKFFNQENVIVARAPMSKRYLVNGGAGEPPRADRGIMMSGLYSNHFQHWHLDILARWRLFERVSDFADYPVYVDAGMPPQNMEALRMVIGPDRHVEEIPLGGSVVFDELIVASPFTTYGTRPPLPWNTARHRFEDGCGTTPLAVGYLREKFLAAIGRPGQRKRRLYVSRGGMAYRQVVNEPEILDFLLPLGFEVVTPEVLTYREQIEVFSEADIVVCPLGSALQNTILCPPEAKVIILGFRSMVGWGAWVGAVAGIGLTPPVIVCCDTIPPGHDWKLNSSYRVPLPLLAQALALPRPA